jgi:Tol biopolymer transport system component
MKAKASTAACMLIGALVLFSGQTRAGKSGNQDEKTFLGTTRQLTYQGRRAGEGYFSPDGKSLIFQSEREPENPFYQIYVLNFDSGETHRVSPGTGKTTCAFFIAGANKVLFASTHMDPEAVAKQEAELEFRASGKKRRYSWDYDETFDIFSARLDGSGTRRLTDSPGYDAEGASSPDGRKIVFCSMRDAYPPSRLSADDQKRLEIDPAYFGEIYIMNADGTGQRRLTDWPGYDGGPFFDPSGEFILWRHFDESGMLADIYTMRLDGSERLGLTDFQSMSWAPYFHPSGEYVIFASNKYGFSNFELFLVDAGGRREPVRVTHTDGFDGLPVFSPDGNRIAWTSNRTADGNSQIFVADWDHDAARLALSAAPGRGESQAARPSGTSQGGAGHAPVGASRENAEGGATAHRFVPEIDPADLRAQVSYLASDDLEGRLTGSKGTELAARFIADYFQDIGLSPLGDDGSYFQEFPFTSGIRIVAEQSAFEIVSSGDRARSSVMEIEKDFRPLGFTANDEVEGEVVFAGYGLTTPGAQDRGYDSYAGVDVKDKIVLVFRYAPEDVDVERRQELNHYAGLRYKAMLARENGAKGLLIATGPNSPNAGELISLSYDQSSANSGIVVASISGELAQALFDAAGRDIQKIQSGLDIENPHSEGSFDVPDTRVRITTVVEREKKADSNVIALLSPTAGTKDVEYIIIGAHYDHIGHGVSGSLARKGEEGQIHNGADDNASGTSTVLEIAGSLAEAKKNRPDRFHRGIVFALWSGEELGIIGSSHFVDRSPIPLENVIAYFNFDMVGRLRENKLIVQGVGSSSAWSKLIEKRNVAAGFDLVLQEDPYLPTDVTAFYPKEIPVLSFFTGSHEDYNRPTDDPQTLEYEGMSRIAGFVGAMITDLAVKPDRPDYVKVERKKDQTGQRAALRTYLGTIPDYTVEDIEGVMLSGVRSGGPADKAGLKGGDVIVELAGQTITNIYDYTYALDAVKIGEPTKIIVVRDGQRVSLTVVPEARK